MDSNVKYPETARGYLAKQIGEYLAINNKRSRLQKDSFKSMHFNENKCHKAPESNFVPVHIAFRLFDPKEGADEKLAPIIFQHGVLCSKENWKTIPQIFADKTKRKVYTLDARNHGESEWDDKADADTFANDLIHFMTTKGIAKCIMVGHNMGGVSGLLAALKQPDMFEMLFAEESCISPMSEELRDMELMYLGFFEKVISKIPPNISEDEILGFIQNKVKKPNDSLQSSIKSRSSQIMPFDLKRQPDGRYVFNANKEGVIQFITSGWSDPKSVFEGPAFFIYGTESPYKINKECIKRHFPKAVFIPVEGASHDIHRCFPEEFTELVSLGIDIVVSSHDEGSIFIDMWAIAV
ncbi:ethanol acetyltransferase 1 [Nephila pilipes]|uniref:sn-1-specific diacylglycerol lipase ABHD11 n=1 Tax=Nephila pilipes TaxID=299642 RepID=A0A8X6MPX7_NEPPI|nr:ethanol acetyltransferase 1 [Nephila pilipes]